MKTWWKRLVALICCTLMVFTTLATSVEAAEKNNAKLLLSVSAKIDEGLEHNLSYVEITETFTEAEWAALREKAEKEAKAETGFNNAEMASAIMLNDEQTEEAKYIDSLANDYYEYYYGENAIGDPVDIDAIIMGEPVKNGIEQYAAVVEPVSIIEALGYYYNASQIAGQLAKIGALMSLGTALPFIHMLGVITGAGILAITLVIAYCAVAVGVNNQLLLWYARNFDSIVDAKQITARIAVENEEGVRFWYAYKANWFGQGGIRIGDAMKTKEEAQGVILANSENINVFTTGPSLAAMLARSCSVAGVAPIGPECHLKNREGKPQPLNVWHYHAQYANGIHGATHVFYGLPN